MKAVSESEKIILAYGAYAKRPGVEKRVEQVMEMLKPHKRKSKAHKSSNERNHASAQPKARQKGH